MQLKNPRQWGWTSIILIWLGSLLLGGCASSEARAARRGDLETLREYIESGGNVNEQQKGGMTLLMYASMGGQVTTMEYLLSLGADIHMKDNDGYSALIYGAASSRENSVAFLLNSGANINDRNGRGETSLYIAASHDFFRVVGSLLDKGANYSITENGGWTPLLAALNESASQVSGINRSAELLFAAGADFTVKSGIVNQIAFIAAGAGNEEVLDLFFTRGLRPDIIDTGGNTLLHAGATHFKLVKKLIERGVGLNTLNDAGDTPLLLAVRKGAEKSVFLLLESGANTEIRDASRKTALFYAAAGQNVEILRQLILTGANVSVTDTKGDTLLHVAAAKGLSESVRLLLTAGIMVNSLNENGQTPYDASFENERYGVQIRNILVAAGAIVPQAPADTVPPPA